MKFPQPTVKMVTVLKKLSIPQMPYSPVCGLKDGEICGERPGMMFGMMLDLYLSAPSNLHAIFLVSCYKDRNDLYRSP